MGKHLRKHAVTAVLVTMVVLLISLSIMQFSSNLRLRTANRNLHHHCFLEMTGMGVTWGKWVDLHNLDDPLLEAAFQEDYMARSLAFSAITGESQNSYSFARMFWYHPQVRAIMGQKQAGKYCNSVWSINKFLQQQSLSGVPKVWDDPEFNPDPILELREYSLYLAQQYPTSQVLARALDRKDPALVEQLEHLWKLQERVYELLMPYKTGW